LKRLGRYRKILLLLILAIFLSSSCSQVTPIRGVAVILPPRPVACDLVGPELQGVVTDRKTIEITIETAVKLRDYLDLLRECVLVRDGYIEKLENRIKAVE
jgi:hypothetical protein